MKKSVYFIGVMFFIAPYVSYAMNFKFLNNGKVQKISIKCGDNWDSVKTDDKFLNTVFQNIDDGDNIVSQLELDTFNRIYKEITNNKKELFDLNKTENKDFDFERLQNTKSKVLVAEKLYDALFAQNEMYLPKTSEDIDNIILNIDKDNVIDVLNVYSDKRLNTESLFSAIMSEYGLNIDVRLKYVKHLFTQLTLCAKENNIYTDDLMKSFEKELVKQKDSWGPASAENIDRIVQQILTRQPKNSDTGKVNHLPNGKIDRDFVQGNIGDCWLLAAIHSIARTPKGKEILDNTVKVNGDNVTVKLKGIDKSYTFTIDEIKNSGHLATGDLDVRAIEMAVNTYITEEGPIYTDEVDLNSNISSIAFQLLTGKTVEHTFPIGSLLDVFLNPERHCEASFTNEQIDNFNKTNHVACVSAHNKQKIIYKLPNNLMIELISSHTYSVERSDKKYIYLIDPDPGLIKSSDETKEEYLKEIPVDRETFKKFFNTINEFDL